MIIIIIVRMIIIIIVRMIIIIIVRMIIVIIVIIKFPHRLKIGRASCRERV